MNPDPRLYLSARRPSGKDDSDPAIADALKQTNSDPKLAQWAERERQNDASLTEKLRSVEPPAGLRERILAGGQFRRRSRWQWFTRPVWLGFRGVELTAAAAAIILLTIALLPRQESRRDIVDSTGWQEVAAAEVAAIEADGGTDPLDYVVNDLPEIRTWLAARTCPSPATLPAPARELTVIGCATREWRGKPLSIVCFAFDGGREVHLVTIDRRNLPASPPTQPPTYATIRGYETASWSEGDVAMMLIGRVQRSELQRLFTGTHANIQSFNRLLSIASLQ